MPFELLPESGAGHIEIRFRGFVPAAELMAGAVASITAGRAQDCPFFLADCTELTGGHTLADLYFLASQLGNDAFTVRIREAVLMPRSPTATKATEAVSFWEVAGSNRGLEIRVFDDRVAALAWLAEVRAGKTDSHVG